MTTTQANQLKYIYDHIGKVSIEKQLQFLEHKTDNASTNSSKSGTFTYTYGSDIEKGLLLICAGKSSTYSVKSTATLIEVMHENLMHSSAINGYTKLYEIDNCAGKTITIDYTIYQYCFVNAVFFKYI